MKGRCWTFSSAFFNRLVWTCLQKNREENCVGKFAWTFSVVELGQCYPCSPFIYEVTFLEILANGNLERKLAHISKFVFLKVFTSAYTEVIFLTNWILKKTCQTVHKVCLQNDCTNSCSVHAIWLKVQSQRQQVPVFHIPIVGLNQWIHCLSLRDHSCNVI